MRLWRSKVPAIKVPAIRASGKTMLYDVPRCEGPVPSRNYVSDCLVALCQDAVLQKLERDSLTPRTLKIAHVATITV